MSGEGQLGATSAFAKSGKSGFTFAYGQTTTVAASDTISTGLSKVFGCLAQLESAPVLTCDRAVAQMGDQAGTPASGSILVKTFMPTGAGDTTPVAATTFSKVVNWVAWGLP